MGDTPGVKARSWVKFRPFRGRSLTSLGAMAVPSSAVEDSMCTAVAWTLISCVVAPTFREKSCVSVWLTFNVKPSAFAAVNPCAPT